MESKIFSLSLSLLTRSSPLLREFFFLFRCDLFLITSINIDTVLALCSFDCFSFLFAIIRLLLAAHIDTSCLIEAERRKRKMKSFGA